ncbi:response regulator [Planktothrix sp. FACHB-1365]|uniref:response regulator n=1 Tax=Planktothrix sp. FACHB-1365 TaxID=2692855 RepID=UPI001687728F|nr:response regulator [Planktothrix sp. FACHB-1365]MBD2482249.1 response regulator [Planktothrix sp. FACHB-1365]
MATEQNFPPPRILIIDNHLDTRLLLIELLQPLSLEIREVSQDLVAIQAWKNWQPDLIFIDVQIPTPNGDKITQKIREQESKQANLQGFKPVKIIAISASPFEQGDETVGEIGYDDFIRKPFTETAIFEAISKQIGVEMSYSDNNPRLDETSNSVNSNPEISSASTLGSLAALSSDLIDQLEEAVIRLNSNLIERALVEIRSYDQVLAETLQMFVNDFNHSAIWDLIQAAKLQKQMQQ